MQFIIASFLGFLLRDNKCSTKVIKSRSHVETAVDEEILVL